MLKKLIGNYISFLGIFMFYAGFVLSVIIFSDFHSKPHVWVKYLLSHTILIGFAFMFIGFFISVFLYYREKDLEIKKSIKKGLWWISIILLFTILFVFILLNSIML